MRSPEVGARSGCQPLSLLCRQLPLHRGAGAARQSLPCVKGIERPENSPVDCFSEIGPVRARWDPMRQHWARAFGRPPSVARAAGRRDCPFIHNRLRALRKFFQSWKGGGPSMMCREIVPHIRGKPSGRPTGGCLRPPAFRRCRRRASAAAPREGGDEPRRNA